MAEVIEMLGGDTVALHTSAESVDSTARALETRTAGNIREHRPDPLLSQGRARQGVQRSGRTRNTDAFGTELDAMVARLEQHEARLAQHEAQFAQQAARRRRELERWEQRWGEHS